MQALNKFQDEVGGALRGGEPGVRLIEPRQRAGAAACAPGAPSRPQSSAMSGVWRIVAAPHIFGTEELSARSPRDRGALGRSPTSCCIAEDAAQLGSMAAIGTRRASGSAVETLRLPVAVEPGARAGNRRRAVGLPGLPYLPRCRATGEVQEADERDGSALLAHTCSAC